uniref:Secreted peptide n=1 Tax=Cacopsylla melanoneura TaxID=428564 RepID=A0A8D9BQG3_9HEMI
MIVKALIFLSRFTVLFLSLTSPAPISPCVPFTSVSSYANMSCAVRSRRVSVLFLFGLLFSSVFRSALRDPPNSSWFRFRKTSNLVSFRSRSLLLTGILLLIPFFPARFDIELLFVIA